MKIMILGGDGYLGWPTSMFFSFKNNDVMIIDNLIRRHHDEELGTNSLTPISSIYERIANWNLKTGKHILFKYGDITDYKFMFTVFDKFRPNVIIHFGEQRSAPYSMIDRDRAVFTQTNNLVGTLNILYCMKEFAPNAHLIKLGTMGEYGTPNIDIEEGFIEIKHNERKDILPFPKMPGSFYHLSKVHDSHNIMFCCKIWDLRATDLNQGVVYGLETNETCIDPSLITRFDYDGVWGTALNRFCVEAAVGIPLTVYGRGGQIRGFINIQDTIKCINIVMKNPPTKGEYRVFNQFTEQFSILELAKLVQIQALKIGLNVEIEHLINPRVEKEEHYYNAKCSKLIDMGLEPNYLAETLIDHMLKISLMYKTRVILETIYPKVYWK